MAGTCAEYDWSREGIFKETDPCRPSTPYGQAKLAVRTSLARSKGDSAWGIIFFPFGINEYPTRLVPSVVRAFLDGKPARCTHGNQIRDFLYVEDLGHGFSALLDSSLQGEVNLASGEGRSIRSVVEALQTRLRGTVEYGALPQQAGEPARLVADTSRLRNELNWSPQIGFEAGLDRTVSWCRCHRSSGYESRAAGGIQTLSRE
jgi:nucleoside-diphosphate-sugar epimerase